LSFCLPAFTANSILQRNYTAAIFASPFFAVCCQKRGDSVVAGKIHIIDNAGLIAFPITPVKILAQFAREVGAFKTSDKTFGNYAAFYRAFAAMLWLDATSQTAGTRIFRRQVLVADITIRPTRGKHSFVFIKNSADCHKSKHTNNMRKMQNN
jgi:hypothetical protein